MSIARAKKPIFKVLTAIQKILPAKWRRLGLERVMEFEKLRQGWDEILSAAAEPAWRGKSRPLKIKNKVLLVDCLNSVWASEFRFREEKILKEIRRKFKNMRIEAIKFIT